MNSVTEFIRLNQSIQKHLKQLCRRNNTRLSLYKVNIHKGVLWNTYLRYLPDLIRQEHNCSCCKLFIERYGGLVGINDKYQLVSIWDVEVPPIYQASVNAMRDICTNSSIKNVFVTGLDYLGKYVQTKESIRTYTIYEDRYLSIVNKTITTQKGKEHFCIESSSWELYDNVHKNGRESNRTIYKLNYKANKEWLRNTLNTLDVNIIKQEINDLNKRSQGNLYYISGVIKFITREINKQSIQDSKINTLQMLIDLHTEYSLLDTKEQEVFCWYHAPKVKKFNSISLTKE